MLRVFFISAVFFSITIARNFELTLVDSQKKGVIGALVFLKGTDTIFESDENGKLYNPFLTTAEKYNFALNEGSYIFSVTLDSQNFEIPLTLEPKSPNLITLILPENLTAKNTKTTRLKEVVIDNKGDSSSLSKNSLNISEARSIPGTGGEALRSVINFPGVVTGSAFSSSLYVRGGDPNDLLYTYGNVPIRNPFHSIGPYSVFPNNRIEAINFYPGAFPVEFTAHQGALLQVVPNQNPGPKSELFLDLNLSIAKGELYVPINDKLRLSFAGKRSFYELYFEIAKRFITQPITLRPFYYDAFFRADYDATEKTTLSYTSIVFKDNVEVDISELELTNSKGETNFYEVGLSFAQFWTLNNFNIKYTTPRIKNELNLLHRYSFLTATFNETSFDQYSHNYYILNDFQYSPNKTFRFTGGASVDYQWVPYDSREVKDRNIYTNEDPGDLLTALANAEYITNKEKGKRTTFRLYAGGKLNFLKNNLSLGASTFYDTINNKTLIEPKFEYVFSPTPKADIFFRSGLYYQQLRIYPFLTEDSGTPSLKTPFASHYVLGSEGEISKNYKLKGEIYYKHYYDQVLENPSWSFLKTDEVRYNNKSFGEAYGAELLFRRRIADGLFGWISYSFSRSFRTYYTEDTGGRPGPNAVTTGTQTPKWFPQEYDTPHQLNFIGSWEVRKEKLKLGLKYLISSGQPYTPFTDITLIPKGDGSFQKVLVKSERINSARDPLKMSLSVRADFTLINTPKMKWDLYLDVWELQEIFYKSVSGYIYDLEKINKPSDIEKYKKPIKNGFPLPFLGTTLKF